MSEILQTSQSGIDPFARSHYIGPFAELYSRWEMYKFVDEPTDFYQTIFEEMQLDCDATILDLGCGNASGLKSFRGSGHAGRLIGVDIDFTPGVNNGNGQADNEDPDRVDLILASGQSLPLQTSSVDASLALFSLYHMPDPELALNEIKRVTKPGGVVAVATSGKANKPRHREFEKLIGEYLDAEPPAIFSTRFDSDIALESLRQTFGDVRHEPRPSSYTITKDNFDKKFDIYNWSLISMKGSFKKTIDRVDIGISAANWREAIDRVVKPIIIGEIEKNGYFREEIDRHYYICQNGLPLPAVVI